MHYITPNCVELDRWVYDHLKRDLRLLCCSSIKIFFFGSAASPKHQHTTKKQVLTSARILVFWWLLTLISAIGRGRDSKPILHKSQARALLRGLRWGLAYSKGEKEQVTSSQYLW